MARQRAPKGVRAHHGFGDLAGLRRSARAAPAGGLTLYIERSALTAAVVRHGEWPRVVDAAATSTGKALVGVLRVVSLLAVILLLVYGSLLVTRSRSASPRTWLRRSCISNTSPGTNGSALQNKLVWRRSRGRRPLAIFAMLAGGSYNAERGRGRGGSTFLMIMPAAVPGLFFGIGYATASTKPLMDCSTAAADRPPR